MLSVFPAVCLPVCANTAVPETRATVFATHTDTAVSVFATHHGARIWPRAGHSRPRPAHGTHRRPSLARRPTSLEISLRDGAAGQAAAEKRPHRPPPGGRGRRGGYAWFRRRIPLHTSIIISHSFLVCFIYFLLISLCGGGMPSSHPSLVLSGVFLSIAERVF